MYGVCGCGCRVCGVMWCVSVVFVCVTWCVCMAFVCVMCCVCMAFVCGVMCCVGMVCVFV